MKNAVGRDAVKLTAAKMITLAITMVNSMLLSRFRTLEEYGTYSQILMVIQLAVSLFMLGLPNSINYFVAKEEEEDKRRHFLSNYYTLNTLLCIVMGVALLLLTPCFEMYFKNGYLRSFAYVFLVYPWSRVIMSSIENLLVVYQRTHLLIGFTIFHSLSNVAVILLAIWLQWNFRFYMVVFIASEAVLTLAVYGIARFVAGGLSFSFDGRLLRQVLAFSIPIGLASVMGTLQIETDKLLIGYFFSTEELAIYTNASKELPLSFFASALTAVLLPKLTVQLKNGNRAQAVRLWGNATVVSYAVICFFAIGLFTYAPEAISLLYSDKYLPGVSVFRVYALLLLLRCTYFGMLLNASGKTKPILYSSVISLILNVILNFCFYWLFGFIGPAIATVCVTMCTALFQLIVTSREVAVPLRRLFPWKALAGITVLNVLFGAAFYFIKQWVPLQQLMGEILESIALGCVWGIGYGALMFRYVRKEYRALNEG
ncbi:MAG TPA: oligosaccharide flippase family protein [Firmicutes bacterium]|nr:oligosaccharide flippase family protein [Bacillota bacterium]